MEAVSEETQTRLCVPAMIQEQGTDGSYTCAVSAATDNPIPFNLDPGSLKQIQKQGNDDVCSYFEENPPGVFVASRLYGMSWAGPCIDGDPCLIRVAMWSHMTDTNRDAGNPIEHEGIKLGFTRVVATLLLEPEAEGSICNPLNGEEDLLITDISIRVQRPGNSHKIMADCQWTADDEPGSEIMFLIVPD